MKKKKVLRLLDEAGVDEPNKAKVRKALGVKDKAGRGHGAPEPLASGTPDV